MNLSDMNVTERELFAWICEKLEVSCSSTETLKDYIKKIRIALEEQKEALNKELLEKQKFLNELEKLIPKGK